MVSCFALLIDHRARKFSDIAINVTAAALCVDRFHCLFKLSHEFFSLRLTGLRSKLHIGSYRLEANAGNHIKPDSSAGDKAKRENYAGECRAQCRAWCGQRALKHRLIKLIAKLAETAIETAAEITRCIAIHF